jgi:pimeloyl-ACP methyl ester carboxylesterase
MIKKLIHCPACNQVIPNYQGYELSRAQDLAGVEWSDADFAGAREFLHAHFGHKLEELTVAEGSWVSEKPAQEPLRVSYCLARKAGQKLLLRRTKSALERQACYEIAPGRMKFPRLFSRRCFLKRVPCFFSTLRARGSAGLQGLLPLVLPFALVLGFFLAAGDAQGQSGIPYVVSTSPANGATGVPQTQTVVSITFSEPMHTDSYSISSNWGSWGTFTVSWSADSKTVYLTRPSGQNPPLGTQINFTLNPQGTPNFRDLEGNALATYSFSFTILADPQAPSVVSTSPANGATGVSRDLTAITITFSKPMLGGSTTPSNWGASNMEWSPDRRTLTFVRTETQRLGAGVTVSLTLNYQDLEGHALPTFTLRFTTLTGYQVQKIEANPLKGFHWPYYLSIPETLGAETVLLIEPNNSGTWSDDPAFHDGRAYDLVLWRSSFALDLDVPLLVPTFPRPIIPQAPEPGGIYTHALDRYSLNLHPPYLPANLERIDLQLIAMIEDARERLSGMGHVMDEKVFLMGFSASGAFVTRFTALHPERVKAVAPGSPGGWPIAPMGQWNGITLRYPVGVADVEQLTGSPFDLNTFVKVPQFIYVGSIDTNDALDTRDMPQEARGQICAWLNCNPNPYIAERWPIAEELYDAVGANAQFMVYPGLRTITAPRSGPT